MPDTLGVGALAHDTTRDRVGVVMARESGRVYLRPQGGGKEWAAKPGDIEPISAEEAPSKRVRDANERSRGARL
jgi:hypothetical protein